jgi:hypothetical protein
MDHSFMKCFFLLVPLPCAPNRVSVTRVPDSPDGRQVVYLACRTGDWTPDRHLPNGEVELRSLPSERGVAQTVATLFGGQGTIRINSWSPDSKRRTFVSYRLK